MGNNSLQKVNNSEALAKPIEITLTNSGVTAAPQGSAESKRAKRAAKRGVKPGMPYAIASFVLGVVALVAIVVLGFFSLSSVLPYGIGIVAAIMGMTFGFIAKQRGDCSGMATAGLVMNITPLAIGLFLLAVVLLGVVGVTSCMGYLLQH